MTGSTQSVKHPGPLETKRQLSEYRQLFDSAADPAVIIDHNGIILDCNHTLQKNYGYNKNELIGQHVLILHHPDEDTSRVQKNISTDDLRIKPNEYRHVTKDGHQFPVEVCSSNITFNSQEAQLSTIRDISQRKQALDALHESEKKFRLAFDSSIIGKALAFLDGPFFWVNPTMCKILGYPPEELIGMLALSITHPDDVEISRNSIIKLMNGQLENDGFTLEKRYIHKSGRIVWAKTMVSLLRDDEKRPLHTIIEIVDITERKNAQEANRQLRNYMANIINSMPSILVGITTDGKITQWNSKAQNSTLMTADHVMGKFISDIFPHFKDTFKKIKTAIERKEPVKETKIPRQSGSQTIYEDLTIYPLTANGVEGAVIRIDDVTEQARLEDMMIQTEKMMSIGGLAAGMAHEINNPLAGIMQNSQVVLSRLSSDLPANLSTAEKHGISYDDIKKYMEDRNIINSIRMIQTAAVRAAKIVQNMLSFARKSTSDKSPNNIVQTMEGALALAASDFDLAHSYDFKKIRIQKDYQPDLPTVFCEKSKIQQVFLNLLKNAAQAMQDKSWDNTETPLIQIRIYQEDAFVHILITDNGPGIDPEVQKRIFEPFFTTKETGKGTGLGLSVSYFIIVEDNHGKMDVVSVPPNGATFRIQLPAYN